MISVEYFTVLEQVNTFCDSISTFNKLLQVDSSIVINGGKITFDGNFSCDYKINSGEIKGKDQRYFHTQFSIEDGADEDVLRFSKFLKAIRAILSKISLHSETLWDDISLYYSKLTYGVIHRTENLMRKLIANFMLTTVGIQWVDEATPSEVKDKIGKAKRKDYINVLHNVDFIHLADFLIKPYSNTSQDDLNKKIKVANSVDDLEAIKSLLPLSNWNRYFSSLVNCDDSYLQKRWSELYDLRCKVAHNAIVSKNDFEQIMALSTDLNDKLSAALLKLPQVSVPGGEITALSDSAFSAVSETAGDFMKAWRLLERHLFQKAAEFIGMREVGRKEAVDILIREGVFSASKGSLFRRISDIRNYLVHYDDLLFSEAELAEATGGIISLIQDIGYLD